MMEKLELKHLAPYLPYGLKGKFQYDLITGTASMIGLDDDGVKISKMDDWILFRYFKPIMRPIKDLTKTIEIGGEMFVPIDKLMDMYGCTLEVNEHKHLIQPITLEPYILILQLCEWHFNVFNLPTHLWINLNTLKETV